MVTDNAWRTSNGLSIPNQRALKRIDAECVVCLNPDCRQPTVHVSLLIDSPGFEGLKLLSRHRVLPPVSARPLPDYVPAPIAQDYQEACLIQDLSPRAAATLARRALQGMIRDFWGISKPQLIQEIDELKNNPGVSAPTWEAIDAVRMIGNTAAHMERDVNVVIDIESDEAGRLIKLIEVLISDWYVARNARKENLKAVKELAESKGGSRSYEPASDATGEPE